MNTQVESEKSVLKNLITGGTQRVRQMFTDPKMVESYLNIWMGTNLIYDMVSNSLHFELVSVIV